MPAESGADAAGLEPDAQALLEHAELGGAYAAADTMSYDDVIDPRDLRDALLAALCAQPRSARRRAVASTTPVAGAEVVAGRGLAAGSADAIELIGRLDAFGQDVDAEHLGQAHQCREHGIAVGGGLHEGAVELHVGDAVAPDRER